jgi:ribulose 1,5-bisphosphate synthetase/thiazole synthase
MKGLLLMHELKETAISKANVDGYHQKLLRSLESDVVIVGAGPAGLTAAFHLAARGRKVLFGNHHIGRELLQPAAIERRADNIIRP